MFIILNGATWAGMFLRLLGFVAWSRRQNVNPVWIDVAELVADGVYV